MERFRKSARAAFAAVVGAALLAGCSGPQPLYDRVGGFATMSHIGDTLVIEIGSDPVLMRRFRGFSVADVQRLRTANVVFACELAGGPCQYRGLPIDKVHRGMDIDDDEFDRMVALFAAAARRASPDLGAAAELTARFEGLRDLVVAQSK